MRKREIGRRDCGLEERRTEKEERSARRKRDQEYDDFLASMRWKLVNSQVKR